MEKDLVNDMLKDIQNDLSVLKWRSLGFLTTDKSELQNILSENHIRISNYDLVETHYINSFDNFIKTEIINEFSRDVINIPVEKEPIDIADYIFDNSNACRRYLMSKYRDIYALEELSKKETILMKKIKGGLEKYISIQYSEQINISKDLEYKYVTEGLHLREKELEELIKERMIETHIYFEEQDEKLAKLKQDKRNIEVLLQRYYKEWRSIQKQ